MFRKMPSLRRLTSGSGCSGFCFEEVRRQRAGDFDERSRPFPCPPPPASPPTPPRRPGTLWGRGERGWGDDDSGSMRFCRSYARALQQQQDDTGHGPLPDPRAPVHVTLLLLAQRPDVGETRERARVCAAAARDCMATTGRAAALLARSAGQPDQKLKSKNKQHQGDTVATAPETQGGGVRRAAFWSYPSIVRRPLTVTGRAVRPTMLNSVVTERSSLGDMILC